MRCTQILQGMLGHETELLFKGAWEAKFRLSIPRRINAEEQKKCSDDMASEM